MRLCGLPATKQGSLPALFYAFNIQQVAATGRIKGGYKQNIKTFAITVLQLPLGTCMKTL
jgi:hypothetical protein